MDTTLLPTINKQLVYLDRSYGSDALAADFVISLITTLDEYSGDRSPEALQVGLLEIYNLVLACRPRMANLIYDLQEALLHTCDDSDFSIDSIRSRFVELLGLKRSRRKDSVQHAISFLTDTNTVLLHSYSSTLNFLLKELASCESCPTFVVAAQDEKKTEQLIQVLSKHNLQYRVVSEFNISHLLGEIDLSIFGSLSLTSDMEVVMGPGSASLISQLNAGGVASYVLLSTNKFSYWEDTTERAFKEVRDIGGEQLSYSMEVFSHDVLPVSLLEGVITEKGVLTPHQAQSLFKHMQEDFFQNERRVRALGQN